MIHSITSKVWASSGSSFFIVSIALFAVFLISALSKIVVFSAFGAKLLTISITPHPPFLFAVRFIGQIPWYLHRSSQWSRRNTLRES
uniref:Uncharacterized protein n=1 Tax=Myoviridae sp. ctnzH2 TaxID=2827707 RepID=A0A8S5S7Z5_9CAUD|nr:MAG TPA: hypothetical protein [Myoviridae sp. ctnzH2]